MRLPPLAGASFAPAELLSALMQGLPSQHKRLLALDTPLPGNPLVVERVRGTEGINMLGAFEIDCLSANAHLVLAPLIGTEVTLHLRPTARGAPGTAT